MKKENHNINVDKIRAVAQTNRLPFDRFRANGDVLKLCDFCDHVPRNAGSKHKIDLGNSPNRYFNALPNPYLDEYFMGSKVR